MVDFIYARIVHILSILLWIGGVAFVTMVVMPAIRRDSPPGERLAALGRIEGGVAPRRAVAASAASGWPGGRTCGADFPNRRTGGWPP